MHTRRSQGVGITTVIENLNPILRGWFNYFKHVKKSELKAMDGFIRRRLRSILRKYQKKGGGTGRNIGDHQQWTNAYFASLGLFTMYEAHAEASRSRWGNYRLESRVRENRTHGSEGGESLEKALLYPYNCHGWQILKQLKSNLNTSMYSGSPQSMPGWRGLCSFYRSQKYQYEG